MRAEDPEFTGASSTRAPLPPEPEQQPQPQAQHVGGVATSGSVGAILDQLTELAARARYTWGISLLSDFLGVDGLKVLVLTAMNPVISGELLPKGTLRRKLLATPCRRIYRLVEALV